MDDSVEVDRALGELQLLRQRLRKSSSEQCLELSEELGELLAEQPQTLTRADLPEPRAQLPPKDKGECSEGTEKTEEEPLLFATSNPYLEEMSEDEESELEEDTVEDPVLQFALRYNLRSVMEGSAVALNGSKVEPRLNRALADVFEVEDETIRFGKCVWIFALCLRRVCSIKDMRRLLLAYFVEDYVMKIPVEFRANGPQLTIPLPVFLRWGCPGRVECVALAGVQGTILGTVRRKRVFAVVEDGIEELTLYSAAQKAEVLALARRRGWKRIYIYEVIPVTRFAPLFVNGGGNCGVIKRN